MPITLRVGVPSMPNTLQAGVRPLSLTVFAFANVIRLANAKSVSKPVKMVSEREDG